jgi:hypothetical protein
MIQAPMGTINRASSAKMNDSGGIMPFSGCRQRTSASKSHF